MRNVNFQTGILFLVFSWMVISCKKSEIPSVETSEITNITSNSATCGGIIFNEGSGTITDRGVCWSTGITPTISDNKTKNGAGAGNFTSNITSLTTGTTYYVRAYATNEAGTGYGMAMSFTTLLADIDGNIYPTITIGNQIWMKENLKTKKYCNGDLIGTTASPNTDISSEQTPKYQWAYGGNENNAAIYGRLYTWYAATDSRNICPTGWHVPSDAEWTNLTNTLGGATIAGGKLKESGTSHWSSPNTNGSNESGFTALPGGDRYFNGTYFNLTNYGNWWSSTQSSTNMAWYRVMNFNNAELTRNSYSAQDGFSIRCIKD